MIASQLTHNTGEEFEDTFSLFSSSSSKQLSFHSSSRSHENKIVSLSEEIFWIEGTVSVAF
jgi:hypothetical protein